jgi:GrpB-like predicted nucleotidyltransferase (UPF0157 family)
LSVANEVSEVEGPRPTSGPVRLVEYDPAWSAFAELQAARLQEALGTILLEVHHVGSTAIPEYLRAHSDIAREYAVLKIRLAEECGSDVNLYADAKTPWIRSMESAAISFYRSR